MSLQLPQRGLESQCCVNFDKTGQILSIAVVALASGAGICIKLEADSSFTKSSNYVPHRYGKIEVKGPLTPSGSSEPLSIPSTRRPGSWVSCRNRPAKLLHDPQLYVSKSYRFLSKTYAFIQVSILVLLLHPVGRDAWVPDLRPFKRWRSHTCPAKSCSTCEPQIHEAKELKS